MKAKPIGTGFGTMGKGVFCPFARVAASGAVEEKPMAARFFTLGSISKKSFCRKWPG